MAEETAFADNPTRIVCVIAAITAVSFAIYFFQAKTPPPDTARLEQLQQFAQQLTKVPQEEYFRDLARRVEGHVQDRHKNPVAATVQLTDALAFGPQIVAAEGKGMQSFFALRPAIVAEQKTGPQGQFYFSQPSLGNKQLFFFADGFAPARRDEVLVADGVGAWAMGAKLEPAKTLQLELPEAAAAGEWRPLYEGWWPDLDWKSVPANRTVDLKWRAPDGFPAVVALRSKDGQIQVFRLPLLERTRDEKVTAASLTAWQAAPGVIAGLPLLPRSALQSLDFIAGGKRLQPAPVSSGAGATILAAQAESAFASVTLRSKDGTEFCLYADTYGEAVIRGVPPGNYTIKTSYSGGGRTVQKGIFAAPGQVRDVDFHRGDRFPAVEDMPPSVIGFLNRRAGNLDKAVVFIQPVFGDTSFRARQEKLDKHSFFKFGGLRRNAVYDLVYASDTEAQFIRHIQRVPITDKGEVEALVQLELTGRDLQVKLPANAGNDDRFVLMEQSGENAIPRWSYEFKAQREFILHDLADGTFHGALFKGDACRAKSAQFTVAADQKTAVIEAASWREEPPETKSKASDSK